MSKEDKTFSAEVKSQARLVAEKKPTPPIVAVSSGDSVTFRERGVVEAKDAASRPASRKVVRTLGPEGEKSHPGPSVKPAY